MRIDKVISTIQIPITGFNPPSLIPAGPRSSFASPWAPPLPPALAPHRDSRGPGAPWPPGAAGGRQLAGNLAVAEAMSMLENP